MNVAKFAVRAGIVGAGVYLGIRVVQRYQLVDKAVVLADELLTKVYNLAEGYATGHLATEDGSEDEVFDFDKDSKDFDTSVPAGTSPRQGS